MKEITSNQNETYKRLKQIAGSAKFRRREQQTILEGVHLCQGYLDYIGRPVMYVYNYYASRNPEVAVLMEVCNGLGVRSIQLSDNHFKALSGVENSVGILFVVDIPQVSGLDSLGDNSLLLDDVQDPGNVGAILRTAAAAGITNVYTSAATAAAWSPKTLRAGMGAHFALTIYENSDLSDLVSRAKVQVFATTLEATESIYDKDLTAPTAWIFGNEGQGVSDDLLSLNVGQVIIPQNPDVESLNVAAATAVCLFEQVRQRR